MKTTTLLITLFLCLLYSDSSRGQDNDRGFRIAFYNLENLFDTENDSTINDEEFTPDGMRYWNEYRYREKCNRMAKAILSMGTWHALPEIIGVAEIENNKVLADLIDSPVLAKYDYNIIHYESPDHRGIDVGMLYRRDKFTPLHTENIAVKLPGDPHFSTRDILYVKGHHKKDTLHLFICHWPSRYGGQQKSEPKRIQAARTLRKKVDSVFNAEPEANIIITGDFNDEWDNVSLREHLRAQKEILQEDKAQLVNLMASLDQNKGSHRYRGVWSYLDQIIVSTSLLDTLQTHISGRSAHVFEKDFLLEKDEKYPGRKPFRTFIGMRYNEGFSDHLPVYIDLMQD